MWSFFKKKRRDRYRLTFSIGGKAYLIQDLDEMKVSAEFDGGLTAYSFVIKEPTEIKLTISRTTL